MEGIYKDLVLRWVYWLGGFGLVRKFNNVRHGIGAIFMYHRIIPDEQLLSLKNQDDPTVVSISRFEAQMKYLAENYSLITMDDLPAHLANPRGFAVAVTFDDGYKDNKVHALPILEKYDIPAVIYVATRFPDNGKGMWWLELESLVAGQNQIRFQYRGHDMVWDVSTPKKRRRALGRFVPMFLEAGISEQENILDYLRQGRPPAVYSHMMMTWDEIRTMAKHPLITIGSHTHSHLDVARLTESQFQYEIEKSKTILETQIGQPIKHFAFPYGSPKRPTERELRLLKPFVTAATTRSLLLTAHNNPLDLPRMQITQKDDPARLDIRLSGLEDMVRLFYQKIRKT